MFQNQQLMVADNPCAQQAENAQSAAFVLFRPPLAFPLTNSEPQNPPETTIVQLCNSTTLCLVERGLVIIDNSIDVGNSETEERF
jgi:hypothetical protein